MKTKNYQTKYTVSFYKALRMARTTVESIASDRTVKDSAEVKKFLAANRFTPEIIANLSSAQYNRDIYDRLKRYDRELQKENLLAKINELGERSAYHKKRLYRIRTWSLSAAAILITGILLTITLQNSGNIPLVAENIENSAILTLPGGKTILLSENEQDDRWQDHFSGAENDDTIVDIITISVPGNNRFRLQLEDGTKVWLNEETSFSYPERFTGDKREVQLEGEAFFDVVNEGGRTFFIHVDENVSVKVLGTRFNINSYADEPEIRVALIDGIVEVANGENAVILEPEHEAVIERGTDAIEVNRLSNSSDYEWIYGLFEFYLTPVTEILDTIADWYGLELVADRGRIDRLGKVIISTIRYNEPEKVMRIISKATGLTFRIEGDKLYVDYQ